VLEDVRIVLESLTKGWGPAMSRPICREVPKGNLKRFIEGSRGTITKSFLALEEIFGWGKRERKYISFEKTPGKKTTGTRRTVPRNSSRWKTAKLTFERSFRQGAEKRDWKVAS